MIQWVIFVIFFPLAWLLALPFYKVTVKGRENIPEHTPFVVVPNHITFMDGLYIALAFRRPFTFLMWYEHYEKAKFLWSLCGGIPVAPRNERRYLAAWAVYQAHHRIMEGHSIVIFPEGGLRKPEEGTLPMRPGYNYLRPKMHDGGYVCPVVPVTISGAWGSLWSYESGYPGTGGSRFFGKRREVLVQIHPPVYEIDPEELQELIEESHPPNSPEAKHNEATR